ncbi:hypothetical protein HPB48_013485 [Haemaphysalis longicornis]|uniref:Uncharacterized protein n=1 Tax=Haemaphysalis longicornis TaxID=44386 RepID=A0A9J6GAP2_HAELO|nr:hypothetical protein HPB48_013485 [Haemaphysalis longicornis]
MTLGDKSYESASRRSSRHHLQHKRDLQVSNIPLTSYPACAQNSLKATIRSSFRPRSGLRIAAWPDRTTHCSSIQQASGIPDADSTLKSSRNHKLSKISSLTTYIIDTNLCSTTCILLPGNPATNNHRKHEWQKHGTCATVVPALDGLVNFFNTTLHMYLKYNFTEYLRNSGVVPSSQSTYKLEDIKEALHDDVKGAANFVCYSSKNYSAPVLAEIRICLSRELQPIDCKPKHSGCGQGEVYYLPFGTDDAVLQTSPFSWLLHCAWLFAISVVPMPVRRLL